MPDAVRNAAPPIKSIMSQPEAASSAVAITPSAPVTGNQGGAVENYREVLKLEGDPDTKREARRRIADLEVSEHEENPQGSTAPLNEAISIYRRLLTERPDDPDNDRVLYQLARAYEYTGDRDNALKALQTLGRKYPQSSLMSDAHFRAGQMLNAQGHFEEAAQEYRVIIDLGQGTQFFNAAQYQYGWSLYREAKYDEALTIFFKLLEDELPPGQLDDPAAALGKVANAKVDMAKNVLHVVGLCFNEMGGGEAINGYFKKHGEPRFALLIYNALGDEYLAKQRYTDAAKTFVAYNELHPDNPNAPTFQRKVISAYQRGGFADQVVAEKERYSNLYAPDAAYWGGKTPPPEVLKDLRGDMEDLGRYYHSRAQNPKEPPEDKSPDLVKAAAWYAKILKSFPGDPHAADINLMYADSLYDAGKTEEAAKQYEHTAYDYPNNPKAPEAAYASVQAWQRLAREVPPEKRPEILHKSVEAAQRLASSFPNHPQRNAVLAQSAVDLYEVKDLNGAATVASQVLQSPSAASPDLQRITLGVVADSRFAQKQWADSEAAYTKALALSPPSDPKHHQIVEQLAASIYHQGEAARAAGNQAEAARLFLKVGQVTPDASIRPTADYDASAALLANKNWTAAEPLLETIRARDPQGKYSADIDKKLAFAYQSDNKPEQAAAVFGRMARAPTTAGDQRRAAAWTSAQYYDKAHDDTNAQAAYSYYVATFPQPLDPAMDARHRLVEIAQSQGNTAQYQARLRDIIQADAQAGPQRSPKSRGFAAHASLILAEDTAQRASAMGVTQPLKVSLARKKQATEQAIQVLQQAVTYNVADVTTAATYDIGKLFQDFAIALTNSQRPSKLSGEALEQYNLLLEEQAEPFEEKAVQAHEANLQRVGQGLWDASIQRSVDALGTLAPGKYGKREKAEDVYGSLR